MDESESLFDEFGNYIGPEQPPVDEEEVGYDVGDDRYGGGDLNGPETDRTPSYTYLLLISIYVRPT